MASEMFDIKEVCKKLGISRREFVEDYLEKDWIRPAFRHNTKYLYVPQELVKFFYSSGPTHKEAISSLLEKVDDKTYKQIISESEGIWVQESELRYFDEDVQHLISPERKPQLGHAIQLDLLYFKSVTFDGQTYSLSNGQSDLVKYFYEKKLQGHLVISQEEYTNAKNANGECRIPKIFDGNKVVFKRLFEKTSRGCFKLNIDT